MEHVITDIAVQKHNKDRVNIQLDGEFGFGAARILAARMHIGDRLTDQEIEEFRQKDEYETAFQKALFFVGYKPRTASEVRARLIKQGFPAEVIQSTIEKLTLDGILDDQQFAENWARQRTAMKPRGRRLINLELSRKGLDPSTIKTAMDIMPADGELAEAAALQYAGHLAGLDWKKFHDRLTGYLLRRGFNFSTARDTVASTWQKIKMEKKD